MLGVPPPSVPGAPKAELWNGIDAGAPNVEPCVGAPKPGRSVEVVSELVAPNEGFPKVEPPVGAPVAVEPHTDWRLPRPAVAPNAPTAVLGELALPNAGAALAKLLNGFEPVDEPKVFWPNVDEL
jgi:hypothetical protein